MQRFILAAFTASLCVLTSCIPSNPASDFETRLEGDGVVIDKFYRCAESVDVPAQIDGRPVKAIDDYAFFSCISLTSVAIPASVKEIGENAFYNCVSLTSVEIANGVEKIGEYAFAACDSLTSVAIPASVKEIGESAFNGCDSLSSFAVAPENAFFKSVDGVLFSADGKTLLAFPKGKEATEYTIPDGVEKIGKIAFWGCDSLTSVALPASVKEIGEGAFWDCADDFTLYGAAGSYAEVYAKFRGYRFEAR